MLVSASAHRMIRLPVTTETRCTTLRRRSMRSTCAKVRKSRRYICAKNFRKESASSALHGIRPVSSPPSDDGHGEHQDGGEAAGDEQRRELVLTALEALGDRAWL